MKYKIIKIQKKPWFLRIFTIEYWWVWVEIGGKTVKLSCWAGIYNPNEGSLIWSIENQIAFHTLLVKHFPNQTK